MENQKSCFFVQLQLFGPVAEFLLSVAMCTREKSLELFCVFLLDFAAFLWCRRPVGRRWIGRFWFVEWSSEP